MNTYLGALRSVAVRLVPFAAWLAAGAIEAQITTVPSAIPAGTAGVPYNQAFTASGGVAPYTFTNSLGRLPNGMTLTASGVLSGTPEPATVPFEISVTDANGRETKLSAATSVIAYNLTLASTTPAGTVGQGYVGGVTPSGGVAPYTCSIVSGSLPPGVALNANCSLTGAPTALGVFNFTVGVVDGNGSNASAPFSITVNAAPLAATPTIVSTLTPLLKVLLAMLLAVLGARRRRT
jgi:large repetitive protein